MRCLRRALAGLAGCSMFGAAAEAIGQATGQAAKAHTPAGESFASWLLGSLGLSGFLALVLGVAIFVGACLVVFRSRRPAVIASYLVFLLLPWLLAILGALKGSVASFSVIGAAGLELKQSQILGGLAQVLLLLLVALVVTLPSYLVIAIGLFVRTVRDQPR